MCIRDRSKIPQRYKLRPQKKNINYKEKDLRCNEVVADAEVETKKKKVKYVPQKDEIFLTYLKEYWETREYKTIELNERDVGRFSNQTQDARWHDDKIVIYTDAACAGNGEEDCKAAYAIYLNDKSNYNKQACIKNLKDYLTTGILTNNRAEIIAIIETLKLAKLKLGLIVSGWWIISGCSAN